MSQNPVPNTLFVTRIKSEDNSVTITPDSGTGIVDISVSGGSEIFAAVTGSADPFPVSGKDGTQGGAITIQGGTSSTSANAGGAASVVGGTPGATGVGGAAAVTGGAGGATSGNGGAANVTGGAGTAGNGSGGSVVLTGGAKNGTGIQGGVRAESVLIRQISAPAAKTTSGLLTGAEVAAGMITVTQGGGANSAQQLPTGTNLQNALPADFAVGDSIDLAVINLGGASETATLTVNTDITIVGRAIVDVAAATASGSGLFRIRKTADHVFVAYRVS